MMGSKKYFFVVLIPEIQFLCFLGPFGGVNSEIPSAGIFKRAILELSCEVDSGNMRHAFETFFFSQIRLRDTVYIILGC